MTLSIVFKRILKISLYFIYDKVHMIELMCRKTSNYIELYMAFLFFCGNLLLTLNLQISFYPWSIKWKKGMRPILIIFLSLFFCLCLYALNLFKGSSFVYCLLYILRLLHHKHRNLDFLFEMNKYFRIFDVWKLDHFEIETYLQGMFTVGFIIIFIK